ncbi:hypothetical protein TNCV_4569071 [Trichonephila clavipes]|nr:hypothetical protein TNCV_4569071 [Trichonephila clavipes]
MVGNAGRGGWGEPREGLEGTEKTRSGRREPQAPQRHVIQNPHFSTTNGGILNRELLKRKLVDWVTPLDDNSRVIPFSYSRTDDYRIRELCDREMLNSL